MVRLVVVRSRVDKPVLDEAKAVLDDLGLGVSDVVRMALARVVKVGSVPPELKIPNAMTRAAMRESRRLMKSRS